MWHCFRFKSYLSNAMDDYYKLYQMQYQFPNEFYELQNGLIEKVMCRLACQLS